MNLKLVIPNKKYLSSVKEAISDYKSKPSKFEIQEVRKMIAAEDTGFINYFEDVYNASLGKNLPQDYVSHTVFWLIDDDNYIGTFNLRHDLTPALERIGGHIAYQIRPAKYRQGYAYEGLKLCLNEAFKKGIERALITCNSENIASYRLLCKMLREYGGAEAPKIAIDNGFEKRFWIHTHKINM